MPYLVTIHRKNFCKEDDLIWIIKAKCLITGETTTICCETTFDGACQAAYQARYFQRECLIMPRKFERC